MLDEIRQERIKKLNYLKERGIEPFPIRVSRDFSAEEAVKNFPKLSKRKKPLFLAGRILALRSHGGSVFCDFSDGTARFQAYLKKDILGEESFSLFEKTVDIGDFVEWKGSLFETKKKEKTIEVSEWRTLSKSLRPLPEKWHGLTDVEERFRKRYLDFLMNEEIKEKFLLRSALIKEIKSFLDNEGFVEVETPMLHPVSGGAIAEPFLTRHNALDINLYLRIAPELYLKRLLIGGFDKIYEIGRNFRNEGIDPNHNPEFTMLELYAAYQDAEYLRGFIENMIRKLIKKFSPKKTDKKFAVINFFDSLERYALLTNPENSSREEFVLKARQFGIEIKESDSKWKIADHIFKKICRPKILQPTFVINYPYESSPLAKQLPLSESEGSSTSHSAHSVALLDRFQLIIAGLEIANGFSELNDPLEQRERFLVQEKLLKAGDKEANPLDEDFLEALEYGMPPAAGAGIGIDRLAMLFTDSRNIKEVILFPTMRPK
jgi:lysyl-tRNA synthetase class 2